MLPRSTRLKPSFIGKDHPLVIAGNNMGLESYGSPTCSDRALMDFPALKIGPGDSARSHMADEYIFIDEIKDGIQKYLQLLQNMESRIKYNRKPYIRMKLWQKNIASLKEVETFTVGKDRELDMYLAPFDVLGSLAHIQMLQTINLLTAEELKVLQQGLKEIYKDIESGTFLMEKEVEDIHSQVEVLLTKKFGDAGKKIHSARSRNDQVLVDLKLYLRHEIEQLVNEVNRFF